MDRKHFRTNRWWRALPLLLVCLLTAGIDVHAEAAFSDRGMRLWHNANKATEPFIVMEVLYFDANGTDSYFTTAPQYGDKKGPAVYVDDKYICSPYAELAWDTHQQTAASDIDQDGWWVSHNPEITETKQVNTYENNDVIIRFYNPHRRSDRPSGEYYVYMFVFLKEMKMGESHKVKIVGKWAVRGSAATEQYKEVTTNSLINPWEAPTATLTGDKKITVFGTLPTNVAGVTTTVTDAGNATVKTGNTTVGIYTASTTVPSGYITPSNLGSSKEISGTTTNYNTGTVPAASFDYTYSYKSGGTIPVQYSYPYTFTLDSYTPRFGGTTLPVVYSWFGATYAGFVYPKNVTYELADPWTKKVNVSWEAEETHVKNKSTYDRSKAGTWMIKNLRTNQTVNINKYATRSGEIAIENYSVGNNINKDDIYVYFVPKDYSGDPIVSLGDSVQAMIKPSWSFTTLVASENGTEGGGIDLNWSHNALEDAASNKQYTLILQRCVDYDTSTDTGNWTNINEDIKVKDKTTVDGSYNDKKDQNSNTTYYYRLKAEVMDMVVYSPVASARIGGSKIKTFSATRGNYSSMVKLQWTVKQAGTSATNFILQRRPLGSEDERDWADIYTTSGTVTSYSYDDVTALPGSFNEYQIIIWSTVTDPATNVTSQVVDDAQKTNGFSVATGIVSGNIAYGTGTAVEGVKVTLKQQTADGTLASGMRSLRFSGYGSGLKYESDKETLKALFDKDFSFQMYLNPNGTVMAENGKEYQLLYVADVLDVKLKCTKSTNDENETTYSYGLSGSIGGASITSATLTVPAGAWSHLSLVYDSKTKKLTAFLTKADEAQSEVVATPQSASIWGTSEASGLFIGNAIRDATPAGESQPVPTEFASPYPFDGYLDEIRLFTKALTEQEILRNYNHLLAGSEEGLAIYYPLDEGIAKQDIAYDFSKKNGVSNGRHAKAKVKASSTTVVPSENELSLMAYTDVNGYYEIRGVPFSGEGTSYSVIPTLGIHEFSPAKQSRYVSSTTLNHSAVDFKDVSSFPVSGTVFYAGTDYPLEGATFYVDGTVCAKDGEMIESDAKGEFTISVPIGDHFITVKKNGHVFADAGRYPADPNEVGTKHTFDREIKNLEFIDETLVNFTGRVAGGAIEGEKSVGFGLSANNIGVTELVLTPLNSIPRMNVVKQVTGTTYSYETGTVEVPIASATDRIASTAWRGAGEDCCSKLYIRTDAATGEFSAMLPPLEYAIESMRVVATGQKVGDPVTVDLSNPLLEYTDTLFDDDGSYMVYTYNTMMKKVYHSRPTFIVTQEDHYDNQTKTNDGAFGIQRYVIREKNDSLVIDDFYSFDGNGKPVYKYGGTNGAAVFVMNNRYTFEMEAYEEYVNADVAPAVTDRVPLAGTVVTISNALSNDQIVYGGEPTEVDGVTIREGEVYELKSNQLALNDEGRNTYSWVAGMPNILLI